MIKTKKISDVTRAKHVFGELTLGDIWPLVRAECESIILVEKNGEEKVWSNSNITMDWGIGLDLWDGPNDEQPEFRLHIDAKVKAKDDHIELESGEKIYFNKLVPIKIKIA